MTIPAAPSSMTCSGSGRVSTPTSVSPAESVTLSSVVCSASRPRSPRTPYARTRSLGWTSSTPSANDSPASTSPLRNWMPIASAWRLDLVVADRRHRLDGRDVEREPERVTDADGAALEVVGVGRRVAVAEVGHDVHEHRARRDLLARDAGAVDDRLERRARLPPAVGEDVEPRLEPLGRLGRVRVGRPDVGDDVAGLVVLRDERAVAQLLVAQVLHPRLVADLDRLGGRLGILRVRDDRRRLDPLLGDPLHPPVEGARDVEAALLDLAARLLARAQLRGELLADLPHEVVGLPLGALLRRDDDRLGLGGLEVGGAELVPVSGVRSRDIWSRTWLRRWTIFASSGTTSCVFVHASSGSFGSTHCSSALRTRSYADGACGMAAMIAASARVRSLSSLPK